MLSQTQSRVKFKSVGAAQGPIQARHSHWEWAFHLFPYNLETGATGIIFVTAASKLRGESWLPNSLKNAEKPYKYNLLHTQVSLVPFLHTE